MRGRRRRTVRKAVLEADRKIKARMKALEVLFTGRVRLSDTEAAARKIRVDRDGLVRCRVCSCTEREACNPPCAWADVDLCTGCREAVVAIKAWREGARRANKAAFWREVESEGKAHGA